MSKLDNFNVFEIVVDANRIIAKSWGRKFYWFIPISVLFIILFLEFFLKKIPLIPISIINFVSLFSGIFFSCIFVVIAFYRREYNEYKKVSIDERNEEDKRNIENLKEGVEVTATLILYNVVLCLLVIFLIILYSMVYEADVLGFRYLYTFLLFCVTIVVLVKYVATSLFLINNIYAYIYYEIYKE